MAHLQVLEMLSVIGLKDIYDSRFCLAAANK